MTISLPPKGNAAKVLESYFTPLRVQAQAIPVMTCQVAEGTFWTADHTHKEYFGGTTPQIFPTLPILGEPTSKWVLVTVTKDGVLNTIDGDASASPVLPLPASYPKELPLAAIFVQNDTTAITNEMIFDIRPLWSVPVDAIDPSDLTDFATIQYVDNGLVTKADTTGTNSYEFTLGDGISSHNNTALIINRLGMLSDVEIRFNETAVTDGSPALSDPRWEFTNDGTNYETLGVASGNYYTKTAADARFVNVSHLTDDVLHITPTQNEFLDGLTLGSPDLSADNVNQLIGITGNVQVQIDADVLNLTNHMADTDVHMTVSQNTFLDGLTLGSPDLSADDVNQLIGITGNVQAQIDAKLNDVTGVANNIAILSGSPTNELIDSTWTLDDAGSTVTDLWSADKITSFTATAISTKADKVVLATVGNIAGLDGAGNLTDTGWIIDDGGLSINDIWSASQITSELTGKANTVPASTPLNFATFVAGGQIADTGVSLVSLTAGFVDTTTDQVVGGNKSFTDDMIIGGNLTVNGANTTINTQNLTVDDKNITLNFGYAGPTSGSDGAGLTVDRNAGSPPGDAAATIIWDDATTRWKAGLDGSEAVIGLEGISLVQPFYEIQTSLGGSPLGGIYTLGFTLKTPVAGTTGLQVFVNGIKQIEGAGKAYQVNYTGPVVVTFESGSEPTAGADVEFYGFGYLA